MTNNPPNWENYTAYDRQQFLKHRRYVCPNCGDEVSADAGACCAQIGAGEWAEICGDCEKSILERDARFMVRRYGEREKTICLSCNNKEE